MKRWRLVGTSLLGLLVWGSALAGPAWSGRGQGFRPCPYAPYVCQMKGICKPFDESGKVAQVLTETLEGGMYPGMAVVLDTTNRGQVTVHLGPVWYLERQEFDLEPGQEVQVQGICLEEQGKPRLIAAQLTVDDHVLLLRDAEGRPMWEAWRKR